MQRIIITQGIPASGKSTWARKLFQEDKSYRRVNRDELRALYGSKDLWYTSAFEQEITQLSHGIILTALRNGNNVVMDDTNLVKKHLIALENLLSKEKIPIIIEKKLFEIDLDVCIERDKNRDAKVGEEVILRMHKRFEEGKRKGYVQDEEKQIND